MTKPSDPIDLNVDSSDLLARNDKAIEGTIDNIHAVDGQTKDANAEVDRFAKDVNDVAQVITDAGQVIKATGI